jgi:hypothetical protein
MLFGKQRFSEAVEFMPERFHPSKEQAEADL